MKNKGAENKSLWAVIAAMLLVVASTSLLALKILDDNTYYEEYFDSSNFFGNPLAFSIYSTQEKKISIDKKRNLLKEIQVYFYSLILIVCTESIIAISGKLAATVSATASASVAVSI